TMSRSSSPDAHWDRLEAWLSAMTGTLLPDAAGGLQHLSREQLDDNLSGLMSHDPTQDNHKDLAKVIGSLAHNLLAQARLSEASISRLEQEAAALKLRAEEAQRDLVLAQSQLDQLETETPRQRRTRDEKDPELQEEVERLQKALTDLRVDTARREQEEKDAREELSEQLHQPGPRPAKAICKAPGLESHSSVHIPNIPMFTPNPAGGHDVHAYLKDIDFHLQGVANVTTRDRLYLLRITSSREVRSFLDRQPETALIKEFSDPESEQGLITAMDLKQARQETTQAYYTRLRRAYFGARNEPGMEEDFNFKTLFLRNMHPTVSHHLGVLACPRSMSIQQLRDLAHKAYVKQRAASEKTVKKPTICHVSHQSPELALEGAQQHYSDKPFHKMSRPFPASRGQHGHGGARPKHRTEHPKTSWDKPQSAFHPKGGTTWEGKRRHKGSRPPPAQASSLNCQQQNPFKHALAQPKSEPSAEQDREATTESAEILRLLRGLLREKHNKGDKRDNMGSQLNSHSENSQTEPHNQITANPLSTTEPDTSSPSDDSTRPSQLTVELPEPANIQNHTSSQDSNVPESAVLVVCLPDEPHETSPDCLPVNTQVPVARLLGNLIERGVAKKLYLAITLEKEVRLEALVDTGADLTLMSSRLFDRLQTEAKRQNRTLKYQRRVLNVQSYSQNEVQLEQVTPIHLTIGPMSLVHPVYIAPIDTYPLLIGKDLLDRFEPLLDFKQLKIWAQSPRSPRSQKIPPPAVGMSQPKSKIQDKDFDSDGPQIMAGLQLNDVTTTDLILALWADNLAISLTLFNALKRHTTNISFANKRTRFALNPGLSTLVTAKWNDRCLTHYFLVLPDLPHDAHVDLINGVIWAPVTSQSSAVPINLENLLSGQTIPETCTLISEQETVVPAYTKGVAVRLNLRCGQTLSHSLGFFQPSPECVELGLTLEATPLVEVTSRAVYILFNNCMAMDVKVPKAYRLGWLVSYDFQDFELVLPVIGAIPVSMIPEGSSSHTVSTVPFKIITILSVVPVEEQVCRTELTADQHLAVYTVSSHPTCETDNVTAPQTVHNTEEVKTEEPYPGFETQVQQILRDADALQVDADCHKLRQVLYKYKDSFAKDSLDCSLTDLHVVRIPTHPKAPPTFVKQYKFPFESYEPVQDIINSMLEKGVIRPCNSTYSAPIWPVLKPNGKWRPTVDYGKLNEQVPLSRWPMTQLEQEIPRIRGATIFSMLDVASGFWTIPVHPDDQHKLAFRFDNCQYMFTRCPFGYANSPAEFNIFLNKACPDARVRGNLVFVDDILLKHTTVADHLKEIDHVLHQLTTAGAKIALHKGQWCRIKVNYVGLFMGPQGIEPQTNRIQAIQNIKSPANISELRSFLGVCNYSRQFIENYSDIARPLTALLKKDCLFVCTDNQQNAMNELKRHLCTTPCLAYPDPQKEFYLDAGFSSHCLSAGLYQRYDQDRRVVAYASKTLLPPECKYSDCEKALLCTVWAIQRFSNYIGAQKVIIETCHQPVTFFNSQ
ncbi:hypothetical protein M9458_007151, partial [Cirrhinus mrigala]